MSTKDISYFDQTSELRRQVLRALLYFPLLHHIVILFYFSQLLESAPWKTEEIQNLRNSKS